MIEKFLEDWHLFHNVWLTGWFIAILLSMAGVVVVARDQIFLGAAVSQASTMGIAIALWIGSLIPSTSVPWVHSESFLAFMAVLFSILATLLTSRGETGKETHEAITGWVFLISASVAILVVSQSPHGLGEVHRIVSSTIVGAKASDVATFAAAAALTALLIWVFHRPLLLFSTDPMMAAAVGVPVRWMAFLSHGMLGLLIGLSIRSSGMIYTFGCLVLPALIAKNISREIRPLFWISPVIAFVVSAAAFVLSNRFDFPPAQMTVALLSVLLTVAWGVRRTNAYLQQRSEASDR